MVKPIAYVIAFVVYGHVSRARPRWTTPLFAGLLRTALGYALGAVAVLLVAELPGPAIQILLAVCRLGLWFGVARLFFSHGTGRGAFVFAVLGVVANAALDYSPLGGAVFSPA